MSLRPLSWYRELAQLRERRQAGLFAVEGPRAVAEIARASSSSIVEMVTVEGMKAPPGPWSTRVLTVQQFKRISNSRTPQGILAVVRLPDGLYDDQLPADVAGDVLVCEHVQDPGNLGNLIRCAAAFGFAGVLLSQQSADPFSPKSVQSSAGTLLSVWLRRTTAYLGLLNRLRTQGYALAAADARGARDTSWAARKPLMLALGSEGTGLSTGVRELADEVFAIPIDSTRAESLNVAAAGAIAMYCVACAREG
jgi:RNA methyltransferase, TrmH family